MNVSAGVQRPVLDGACRNAGRRILGDDVTVAPVAYATPPNYPAASALGVLAVFHLFGHLRGQRLAQLGPGRRDEHHQHWSTRHRRQRTGNSGDVFGIWSAAWPAHLFPAPPLGRSWLPFVMSMATNARGIGLFECVFTGAGKQPRRAGSTGVWRPDASAHAC